jgi:minichromosome maintenance protein 10
MELQDHLRGRYYLSPSLMYSVIRPLPSNQGYDIPVPGDWVTIAVIAEMGPIKLTTTSSTAHNDDDDITPRGTKGWKAKGKQKGDGEDKKTSAKKYMSLKLVDFGTRGRTSAGAPKAQVRGDALLTLLLFEADSWSYIESENRPKSSKSDRAKVYKGGSGGAFEACMKLHEGAVIAILNPRILKPYQVRTNCILQREAYLLLQRNTATPHPTNNILAITPTSAQSIAIIGHSRDLGMCGATKRDGKICGSWCDKRVSDCCEYHVEHAVQRKRAGRAEFSMG